MSFSKVLSNSGIYAMVAMVQRGLNFLLLPLYTAFLSPTDYGVVGLITGTGALLSAFYTLSLHGAGTVYTAEFKDSPPLLAKLWGNILFVVFFHSLAWTILLSMTYPWVLSHVLPGIGFWPLMAIGFITFFSNSIYGLWQSYLQALQEGKSLGLNNTLFFVINLLLTLFFVVVIQKGALGFLIAQAIANALFAVYALWRWLPHLDLKLDLSLLKKCLVYSLPLIPHNLSSWIGNSLDRFFLNGMVATAAVGVYNVAFQWTSVLSIICFGVNQAYVPWYLEQIKDVENGISKIMRFFSNIFMLYLWVAMALSYFAKEILMFMTPQSYHEAWTVVPILLLGGMALGFYLFAVAPVFEKNSKKVPLISLGCAVFSLVLNATLIPVLGLKGAAISYVISQSVMALMALYFAQGERRLPYSWMSILTFMLATLVLVPIPSYLEYSGFNLYISFSIKLIVFLCFSIAITIKYKAIIISFWKSKFNKGVSN